jgi:hypothetical protein
MKPTVLAAAAVAGVALPALAQTTQNAVAVQTGTIQPTGPRPPANGDRFFNIEGLNSAAFASYGVARFDLSAVRAAFDSACGAGQWHITAIELEMTQDNAAFSAGGGINVYYSTDDTTDVKTAASPLMYPFIDPVSQAPDLPLGNGGSPILSYTYDAIGTGTLDRYTQTGSFRNGVALRPNEVLTLAPALVNDIMSDNTLTLVFVEGDPAVAATYRGQEAFSPRVGPNLFITAACNAAPCYPDCDHSHSLNVNDFVCFQSAFAASLPAADCDHNSTLNVNDFVCFQSAFAAGCSAL